MRVTSRGSSDLMEICRNRRRRIAMPVQKYNFKPFGQAIKAEREKKGLTRKELAAQIHISSRYLSVIEKATLEAAFQRADTGVW